MSKLAIIANPNAHRNRNWPLASQALRKAAPGAAVYETRTEAELKEAARKLSREEARVIAIAGGDGTVTHTATMLGETFHGKVPPPALLDGGAYPTTPAHASSAPWRAP